MRLFIATLAVIIGIASASSASAQSFLLGVMVGAGITSGSTSPPSGGLGEVIYLMPEAAERIKDPLELRMTGSSCHYHQHLTVYERFRKTVNAERYELVHVLRLPSNDADCIRLWFTYIEKEKVLPKKVAQGTNSR